MKRWTVGLAALVVLVGAIESQGALINNGDFELGNTGFTSDYTYVTPTVGLAQYYVSTNPQAVHPSWYSFGDHTTGTGMMLIVNGGDDAGLRVWIQEVTLTAGDTYEFSAWGTSVYPVAPGNLIFEIGGTSLGTLELTSTVPDWKEFSTTFTASTSGPSELVAIRDLETAYSGNDFALDDISLELVQQQSPAIPEPATIVIWSLLGLTFAGAYRWRRRNGWSKGTTEAIHEMIDRDQ